MIGTPLTFKYGNSTGLFIENNELRIGTEPQGYRLVLSTGTGEFPIRPYLVEGQEYFFADKDEAIKAAVELSNRYKNEKLPE